MHNDPRRFGITRKLFIAFIAVAIIPLLFALVVSIIVFLGQAKIIVSEVLWGKSTLAKLHFDERRDALGRTLSAASRNNSILVNMELTLDSAVSDALAEISQTQNMSGLWVLTTGGTLYVSANDLFIPERSESPPSVLDETLFSIEISESGTSFLVGRRALVSGTGINLGYICGAIDLHQFCFATSLSVKTPVFIHPVLSPIISSFDPGLSLIAVSSIVYSQKGKGDQQKGTINGVPYIFRIIPIDGLQTDGAKLIIAYPDMLLSGPRNRAIVLIFLSSLFAVVLAGVGGMYFRRSVIKPVLSIAAAARVIAEGIYGNTVEIDTQDEVGMLARDFNRMSERLHAQVKDREKAERVIEESLREKETLLREIHHRVKNNFQIINSLFDLQLMSCENEAVQESLKEPKARIHAMALVHDRLYVSETFTSIDFSDYVSELAQDLFYSYNVNPARISLLIDTDVVSLDMDRAIPCGLILNELITNSLKYAFPDPEKTGHITMTLKKNFDMIILSVQDDGAGFKSDPEMRPSGALGITLVQRLCKQIKGSFTFETTYGVRAVISFPI